MPTKTPPHSRRVRATRDGLILGFALAMGTYEVVVGGGRASVLAFLSGLLLSPIALRFDESRREDRR